MQKSGTVPVFDGRGTARHRPDFTEMRHQLAVGERAADGILREKAALEIKHGRAGFQAARGEKDVAGDHDFVRGRLFRDPVVGGVERVVDDHEFEPILPGNPHPGVRDQDYPEAVPFRHAEYLRLHRAGVGIDQYPFHVPVPGSACRSAQSRSL